MHGLRHWGWPLTFPSTTARKTEAQQAVLMPAQSPFLDWCLASGSVFIDENGVSSGSSSTENESEPLPLLDRLPSPLVSIHTQRHPSFLNTRVTSEKLKGVILGDGGVKNAITQTAQE